MDLFFSKSIYKNYQKLLNEYKKSINLINCRDINIKIIIRLFNYLKYKGVPDDVIKSNRKLLLKKNKSIADNYVPTDEEVKQTLSKLRPDLVPFYLLLLFSGIRISEGKYLLTNISKLKIQTNNAYCKVGLNYAHHNKGSFFCYLPLCLYTQLSFVNKLGGLATYIARNNLIPLKYCRKWFFTKCIELGIPESIADFYEGRVATSVGSNHYLSRQMLADRFYFQLVTYFEKFMNLKNKEGDFNARLDEN